MLLSHYLLAYRGLFFGMDLQSYVYNNGEWFIYLIIIDFYNI